VPPYSRVVDPSSWTNGLKMAAVLSGRTPMPVSAIAKWSVAARSSWLASSTERATSPAEVNFTAFPTRLRRI